MKEVVVLPNVPTQQGLYWWTGEDGSAAEPELVKLADYGLLGDNPLMVCRFGRKLSRWICSSNAAARPDLPARLSLR